MPSRLFLAMPVGQFPALAALRVGCMPPKAPLMMVYVKVQSVGGWRTAKLLAPSFWNV